MNFRKWAKARMLSRGQQIEEKNVNRVMQNIPQFQGVIFRTGSMGTKYVARYTNQTFKQVMSRHTYTSKCITWYNERSKIIKEKFIKMSLSMRPLEASELGQCLVK